MYARYSLVASRRGNAILMLVACWCVWEGYGLAVPPTPHRLGLHRVRFTAKLANSVLGEGTPLELIPEFCRGVDCFHLSGGGGTLEWDQIG
jgi:hypothetical protein